MLGALRSGAATLTRPPAPATQPRAKRRRTAPKSGGPRAVLAGPARIREQVFMALSRLPLDIQQSESCDPATLAGEADPPAIVVVAAPAIDTELRAMLTELAGVLSSRRVPLLVATRKLGDAAFLRSLYQAGVTVIFRWPSESALLVDAVRPVLRLPLPRATGADAALERAIHTRLRASPTPPAPGLQLVALDGWVYLAGTVAALWQVQEILSVVQATPGVRGAFDRGMQAATDLVPDRRLRTRVRRVIEQLDGVDAATLSVRCDQGRVMIAGEVGSKTELDRLDRAVRDLRGVVSLEVLATIAPKARRRDVDLARQATRTLRAYYPGNRLRVAAFGGNLVLEGKVDSAATRRAAEVLVGRLPGVRRVVNKLRVLE